MSLCTLYRTNTLHRIASYLPLPQQLALRCLNRKMYSLSISYLSSDVQAFLYPERFAGKDDVTTLLLVLHHTFTITPRNERVRERRNTLLKLLHPLASICTINVEGLVTPYLWSFLRDLDVSKQEFHVGLFEMSEQGMKSLYKDVVLRDRTTNTLRESKHQPPGMKRTIFLLDTTHSLNEYDVRLDCQGVVTMAQGSIEYDGNSYTTANLSSGNEVVQTFRGYLIEAWLWHLWVQREYGLRENFLVDVEVDYRRGAVRLIG